MTMVERVARALCAPAHIPKDCGWSLEEIAEFVDDHWREFIPEARVAIEAMREPTAEMVLAAVNTHPRDMPLGACIPTARWKAMIAAALSEKDG